MYQPQHVVLSADEIVAILGTIKVIVSVAFGGIAVALGFLFRLIYKAGMMTAKLTTVCEKLTKHEAAVEAVPVLAAKVEMLEKNWDRFAERYRQANGSVPDGDGE